MQMEEGAGEKVVLELLYYFLNWRVDIGVCFNILHAVL